MASFMNEFGAPNFSRAGESTLVLDCGDRADAQPHLWSLARTARSWAHVREAVVGAGTLSLLFDRNRIGYDALCERLEHAFLAADDDAETPRVVEIPVQYDGEDLAAVAHACGLRCDEVIALHAGGAYVVAFVGFLPGFAYLDGLPERLQIPRRSQPRTRVPAGSVAIAGAQSGIYPFDSPGGWHIIGRTGTRMFDPQRTPAALAQPGDRVRFVIQ